MNKRRQEVFTQRVLHRLYNASAKQDKTKAPGSSTLPGNERKILPNEYRYDYDQDDETKEEKSTDEIKRLSTDKVRVFTASLPPGGLDSMKSLTDREEQESESEDTSSSDSETDVSIQKRKRKRRHKRGNRNEADTLESTKPQNQRSERSEQTTTLTKNQRRKLRKKKRKQYQNQGSEKTESKFKGHEFTFEPVPDEESSRFKRQEEKSQDLQEFFEAVWDVYFTEVRRTMHTSELQAKTSWYEKFMVILREDRFSEDILDKLLEVKQALTLQAVSDAEEKLKSLECDVAIPEELRKTVVNLSEYWIKDIAVS